MPEPTRPARPRRWPLWELTRARLAEFVREPAAIFWTFGFPILLAVALGIAFRSTPPAPSRVAAWGPRADLLRGVAGLELVPLAPEEGAAALRVGAVDLLLVPAAQDPSRDLLRFDPLRPEGRLAQLAVERALLRARAPGAPEPWQPDPVEVPGARYIDFLIPGLVGLNLLSSAMWGLGYALVQARRQKLMKRFAVTPMRRWQYLLSFLLSRLVFLAGEVGALLGFGWLVFDLPLRGSLVEVSLFCLAGGLSFSGLALLIAARPQNVEVASGWINFATMPMWLLSGTFFSASRFPAALQPWLQLLPLTAFNDGLRALVNEGASLTALGGELVVLAAWGALSFGLALKLFRWQ